MFRVVFSRDQRDVVLWIDVSPHQDTQTPFTNGYTQFAIYLFKVMFNTLIPLTTPQLLIRTAPINPLLFPNFPTVTFSVS
jgi:hypothetical protein